MNASLLALPARRERGRSLTRYSRGALFATLENASKTLSVAEPDPHSRFNLPAARRVFRMLPDVRQRPLENDAIGNILVAHRLFGAQ